ncbi:MAG: type 4a pilus biogenesis protein PilO [Sedimentisphaerales bacterium]|nr:type 4a pilus biogenesis protein PilO [Sedimentisphaerales bacterium]
MLFRERQQIAICATAAAMICGFVLFRYLPLQSRMKSLKQAHIEQMLIISRASAANQQMPAVREQLQQLQTAVEKYELQIPSQRELGEFLQKTANLMNEHNLNVQMIQPGREIQAGKLNCIPVNMQCKGKLPQIFEFYKCLQKLDRLVRIERVKLVNDSGFSGEATMQTEVVIYYRAETEQG